MQPKFVSVEISWLEGYDITVVVDDHYPVVRQLPPTNSFDDAWKYAMILVQLEFDGDSKDAKSSDRPEGD